MRSRVAFWVRGSVPEKKGETGTYSPLGGDVVEEAVGKMDLFTYLTSNTKSAPLF